MSGARRETVPGPWATAQSRFTVLFERLAIAWLKEATPAAVARRLGLTWEEANGIVERAVRRGLDRRRSVAGRRLGIDEHSYLKHFQFVTIVDLDEQTALHVADDRTAETLASYFEGLTIDERLAIDALAMDMWDPYRRTVRDYVPDENTEIVFDKFHVMRHVTEAMDQVRRREQRELRARGDRRLTGTKFLWLKTHVGRRDFTADARRLFRQLRASTLKSARAWAMKEAFRHIWNYGSIERARAFFHRWQAWVIRSRLSTDDPCRRHHPPTSREHPELPKSPDHERRHRRAECEDSVDQVLLPWIPRSRTVQAGDLLPQRRSRSQSLTGRLKTSHTSCLLKSRKTQGL